MEELKQLLLQLQKAKHFCCARMISRPRTFHRVKKAEHQQNRRHQFAIVGDDLCRQCQFCAQFVTLRTVQSVRFG